MLRIQITCLWKEFEIENLDEYQDFYFKSDTIIHLDPVKFCSAPGLAW